MGEVARRVIAIARPLLAPAPGQPKPPLAEIEAAIVELDTMAAADEADRLALQRIGHELVRVRDAERVREALGGDPSPAT